jgi:hypothetical protein
MLRFERIVLRFEIFMLRSGRIMLTSERVMLRLESGQHDPLQRQDDHSQVST